MVRLYRFSWQTARCLRDNVLPFPGSDSEQERGDPDVPPEDEELFETSDADAMEEAISKFVDGLERQASLKFRPISNACLFLDLLKSAK